MLDLMNTSSRLLKFRLRVGIREVQYPHYNVYFESKFLPPIFILSCTKDLNINLFDSFLSKYPAVEVCPNVQDYDFFYLQLLVCNTTKDNHKIKD